MKKKHLLLTLLALLSLAANAQDTDFNSFIENRIVRKPTCYEIALTSANLFCQFMSENKTDSARYALDYWINECQLYEYNFRARVLLDLYENKFDETIFDQMPGSYNAYSQYILDYKEDDKIMVSNKKIIEEFTNNPSDSLINYYNHNILYYLHNYRDFMEFNSYTKKLACELIDKYPEGSTERWLTRFYSGDSESTFQELLSKDQYKESPLRQKLDADVRSYKNLTELHVSLLVGTWIPTGNLNRSLGIHPSFGFQLGFKHKKMNYDLTLILRSATTPKYYQYINHDGELANTRSYFGGYLGLDVGRDIWCYKKSELQVLAGIGWDGLDIVREDKKKDIKAITVNSLNLNTGLGYRFYFSRGNYLGIQAKYNQMLFNSKKHFDYGGSAFSIHLIWGGLSNSLRQYHLNRYGAE